jgi:lipopolysaccharide biosynthesis glycosyltransferase
MEIRKTYLIAQYNLQILYKIYYTRFKKKIVLHFYTHEKVFPLYRKGKSRPFYIII